VATEIEIGFAPTVVADYTDAGLIEYGGAFAEASVFLYQVFETMEGVQSLHDAAEASV
jgi:hypothetical protein